MTGPVAANILAFRGEVVLPNSCPSCLVPTMGKLAIADRQVRMSSISKLPFKDCKIDPSVTGEPEDACLVQALNCQAEIDFCHTPSVSAS